MPEFDFAPRPPKQTDEAGAYSPFGPGTSAQDDQAGKKYSPFGAASAGPSDQAGKKYSPFGPALPEGLKPGNDLLSSVLPAPAAQVKPPARSTRGRSNPAESEGMLSGLISMATTMGMSRLTNGHVDPISSPTGILGMIKTGLGAKHEQADDHMFNLDITRHGTAGGGVGGMSTGLGMVGGPVQAMGKRESTSAAMRAIGSMARSTGGGLSAMMGGAGGQARSHMHWLDQSVKHLYKVER